MNCTDPILLKNGLVVPCGKCLNCRSAYRNDWSVRLQLTTDCYARMPKMVTLTYDDDHIVLGDGRPTLVKSHPSLFVKRFKDRAGLYNEDFQFFGCGEYGDKFGRSHYHVLLYTDRLSDDEIADLVRKSWTYGHADVVSAEWSGIHYVTKYCLKFTDDEKDSFDGVEPSFTFCTRGFGKQWLETSYAKDLRESYFRKLSRYNELLAGLAPVNFSSAGSVIRSCRRIINELAGAVPKYTVVLPSGHAALLPRYYRRKIIGTFEYFADNGFWYFDHIKQLLESYEYIEAHGDRDRNNQLSYHQRYTQNLVDKIHRRLLVKSDQNKSTAKQRVISNKIQNL